MPRKRGDGYASPVCMWFLIGLRRLLTRSQAAVVLGGFSQPGCVTYRRQAEEPLVLAAEVRGVLIPYAVRRVSRSEAIAEDEAPLLRAQSLLELQGSWRSRL